MVSYASIYKQVIQSSSDAGSSGIPDSRSPKFHYKVYYPSSVQELPLPAPHLLSKQESGLEKGRKVYVDLTTFVGPDPELYMTEYVAICNTRFIKGHKPSNHIRARIKSHVYTTE